MTALVAVSFCFSTALIPTIAIQSIKKATQCVAYVLLKMFPF
nr:MAG TPA: hypothetical protein [Bacteriophage sp.]